LIFEGVDNTTKEELKSQVPKSANAILFIGVIVNMISFTIYKELISLMPTQLLFFSLCYLPIFLFIYWLNRILFIKNSRYLDIVQIYRKEC
tara:strand:- start:1778 stop:2050 length:273 start_codon:yes stop_codon:yes gene_type:complete